MTIFDEPSKYLMRLVLILDFLLVLLCALVSRELAPMFGFDYIVFEREHWLMLVLLSLSYCAIRVYAGAYHGLRLGLARHLLITFGASFFAVGAVLTFALIFFGGLEVDPGFVLGSLALGVSASFGARFFIQWWYLDLLHGDPAFRRQIVMVGMSAQATRVAYALDEHSEWGVDVIGFVKTLDDGIGVSGMNPANILGTLNDLDSLLGKYVVDEVIVVLPLSQMSCLSQIFDACTQHGIRVKVLADSQSLNAKPLDSSFKPNQAILEYSPVVQHQGALFVKRAIDMLLVCAALPLLLPLLLMIAIAIKLDSPGPVFFSQQRVGFRKRVFSMYKFRSMVQNAESLMKEIEYLNEANGPNFKINNDPRVTRVGRVLRKLSLDELPQLFNVLLGQMTLVGPRPMSLRDVDLFDSALQHKRFSVLPGLTCLWQISGRSNLGFDQWLALDLEYIDNWSLTLDLKIFLKTFPVILKGEGAV